MSTEGIEQVGERKHAHTLGLAALDSIDSATKFGRVEQGRAAASGVHPVEIERARLERTNCRFLGARPNVRGDRRRPYRVARKNLVIRHDLKDVDDVAKLAYVLAKNLRPRSRNRCERRAAY